MEHGTRGGDEINISRKGKDYGWPTIAYGTEYTGGAITGGIQAQDGMEQPLYYWDPVIAPSGMTFYTGNLFPAWKNNLFIGGLGSQALVRLTIDGERVVDEERLLTDMARADPRRGAGPRGSPVPVDRQQPGTDSEGDTEIVNQWIGTRWARSLPRA